MASSVLITGASGFIGRYLVAKLSRQSYDPVYCLTRRENTAREGAAAREVQWLVGDIFDGKVYAAHLDSSSTVIHLAATTGKAQREEYFAVNSSGTRYLLAQCKQRGVKNFLYVSSIAVKYDDKAHYHYAQSKEEGEQAVIESGLNYAIVRPTITLGKESPGWKTLSKLGRLRLIPLLGDGTARIQPIDVDDLADAMISLIGEGVFRNESFDLGGPDVLSIEEFLRKIHRRQHGDEPTVLHLPREPLCSVVAYADKYCSRWLPLNAGQLSVFFQDGTITANRLHEGHRLRMKGVDTMLRKLMD